MLKTEIVTQPATEPVTLDEVKAHLNITFDDDNAYLTSLITSTRGFVEDFLNRKLISQQLADYRDRMSFSLPWWNGVVEKPLTYFKARVLETAWLPVISIDEVSTFNDAGTETVYSASNYRTDVVSNDLPGRVVLADSATWPTDLRLENAIRVLYTAGYGASASDVPAQIRHGLLEAIMYMYVNRGACSDITDSIYKSSAFMFLQQYRIRSIG